MRSFVAVRWFEEMSETSVRWVVEGAVGWVLPVIAVA